MLGDEEGDFFGEPERYSLGFLQDDRDPHFLLRRLDRHGETPRETRLEALVHAREVLGVSVAGDNQLLVSLDQRVESVEKLFLRSVLAGEELDVVDQKKIERMVVTLELVEGFLLIGANHIGDILRGVKIADAGAGMLRENEVADRMDQVRLAKTHATVDEQRVVPRMFSDL